MNEGFALETIRAPVPSLVVLRLCVHHSVAEPVAEIQAKEERQDKSPLRRKSIARRIYWRLSR